MMRCSFFDAVFLTHASSIACFPVHHEATERFMVAHCYTESMPALQKIHSDPEELLARIRRVFPNLKWSHFRYLDEGWDHEVIILDETWVFCFPNDPTYGELLKGEIAVLRQLKPRISSVHIPAYTYIAPDDSFAGYAYLQGRPLTTQYFATLSISEKTSIVRKLADFLSDMHAISLASSEFQVVPLSDLAEAQAEDKQLARQHLQPILTPDDYRRAEAILAGMDALLSRPTPTVLLHGDMYSTHLLWDGAEKELGIIDFSDMNRGDPAFDFAELYDYGHEFVEELYKQYRGPKDATFLQRAQTYQKWVGVFMMVDHFIHQKTSFEKARETFDRTK